MRGKLTINVIEGEGKMAPDRESEGKVVIVLSNGPALITIAHNGRRVRDLASEKNRAIEVIGRLTNERQDCTHTIFLYHVVRISPYFESAPDTDPVGCATVEELSSERPPLEVSGY